MEKRVALVTGAAAGIGRACALRLAADGHAVGLLDLHPDGCAAVLDEIRAAGGQGVAVAASIADRAGVTVAVDTVRRELGPVTILVNNAGISIYMPFDQITDEAWSEMFDINVRGTFVVTQTVLPDMRAAQWGRIVNISSSSAQTGSDIHVHYAASKGAIVAMTRSLAKAFGPEGITVNNIPPGSVLGTVMSEANVSAADRAMLERTLPVRRVGRPEDIASACAWLCSEGASYVTGQTIGVNGGRVVS